MRTRVNFVATILAVTMLAACGSNAVDVTPRAQRQLQTGMDDIRTVMDAAGIERAAQFGISEGGSLAAIFAATHPERTNSLILYGILV